MLSYRPKIALVHDDLIQFGGAERLLLAISEIWPNVPIYTAIYDPRLALSSKHFADLDIRASFMQKLPFKKQLRRIYFPLYPFAFESFDFSEYDIVISSSTRFAHSVITKPKTIHICYLNSPPRFLWDYQSYLKYERFGQLANFLLSPLLSYLRIWDQTVAASRVDSWIANSKNVASKIKKYYRADAKVIYPFVDLEKFQPKHTLRYALSAKRYYLVVSRLLPWKRVDLAIEAANKLKFPLKIIGTGPDFSRLKNLATEKVEFLGEVDDKILVQAYQNAKATIVTQEEDFGIVALESQACGTPVIAYFAGGNLETIIPAKTGLFFESQEVDSLVNVIINFEKSNFDPQTIRANAEKFSKANFQKKLKLQIEKAWQKKINS